MAIHEAVLSRASWAWLAVPGARLVRVLSSQPSAWTKGVGNAEKLAEVTFTKAPEDPVSVFLVRSPLQEVRVVAAFQCQRGARASAKDPVRILRIGLWDLLRFKVGIRWTTGDTGVRYADARHRDLHADPANYVSLTKFLLAQRTLGHDNVREIPPMLLVSQLDSFATLGDAEVTRKARDEAARQALEIRAKG